MKDYNDNVRNIFELIAFNEKYKVIGSASKDLFFSDYDLNSIINYKGKTSYKRIYTQFKKVFEKAKRNSDIWITDFKLGEDESGEPLRWTYNDILKNENKGYTFTEALKQKSTIKIDITFYLDGKFLEITDNYFFNINGYRTFNEMTTQEKKKDLIEKFYEYVEKNAYMKALKRLRSLIDLNAFQIGEQSPQGEMKILYDNLNIFFNGSIGYLYTLWSEISVIIQLIQLDSKISLDKINRSLQNIKEGLSFFNIKNNINKIVLLNNRKKIKSHLEKQNLLINKYINKECCLFIKKGS